MMPWSKFLGLMAQVVIAAVVVGTIFVVGAALAIAFRKTMK